MKDSIITGKRKKTELIALLICFIIANLLNLYAIIVYETRFKELFTQLGYITLFAVVLYVFWVLLRIIFYSVKRIINSINKKS